MIEKYEFSGSEDGISVLILAAVHGNETAGTIACQRFLHELNNKNFKIIRGQLTIVPICNPEGYRRQIRSVDENLNRVIKWHSKPTSYEQKLANEIYPLIKKHQVMLDLHSTHCEGDVPFAFCDYPDEINTKVIGGLPVEYVLEGWPQIYANSSDIQDFSTEQCAHGCGNTGTTLECGYHLSSQSAELAYQAIINTLKVLGLIEGEVINMPAKTYIKMQSFVIKQREGKLCKPYKHLDTVVQGEPIAQYDDGEFLTAPQNGYILLPNHNSEIGAEWYYLGVKKSV